MVAEVHGKGCVRGVKEGKPPRGKFISLEGGDGVGKSTQITLLGEAINEKWGRCTTTREPGGSAYAEEIRRVILSSEYGGRANAMTMFALFWAARADHIEKTIRPSLLRGCHVITDRFDGATFSYQICGQESHELRELFFQTRRVFVEDAGVCPDLYIFLDMDPEEGLRRVAERRGEPMTHFDQRELDFHKRLRVGCREFAGMFPSVIINADQEREKVHSDIMDAIEGQALFS